VTDVLLATSAECPDGEPAGELLLKAFADRELTAAWARWDDPAVDWSAARVVAVRSVWDYEQRLEEFLAWTDHVARWSRLLNGPGVFRWNTDKAYLLDLERIGVPVVPTALLDDPAELAAVSRPFGGRVVVKPRVAAGGRGLTVQEAGSELSALEGFDGALVDDGRGPWLVQPLVESVRTEGETSVFVLAGVPVSQARKLPAGDEIRVHEAYGGTTVAVEPTDEAMLLAAETVAAARQLFDEDLCYARVDCMRLDDGRLVVGELELTEPGLYLDVLPANAEAFADVVLALVDDQVTVLEDALAETVAPGVDAAGEPEG
jgi:glutathione synthase/RimK-type ligase-like ATP-grasp enzyme